jgi:hypothetical protein
LAEQVFYGLDADGERNVAPNLDQAARAKAVAEYLADMTGQLEGMARLQGFDLVAYLLSMARVEAQSSARALQDKKVPAGRQA